MKKITGLFALFFWDSKMKISRSMEYRFDFVSGFIISFIYSLVGPLTQYLIFTQTKGYPGWNINQVLLFQGVLLLWTGFRYLIFGGLRGTIQGIVWKGDFDRYLLKPYSTIGVLMTGCFSFNNIGTVISGIIITIYYASILNVKITLVGAALTVLAVICAVLLYMALLIFFSGIVIVMVQAGRIWEILDSILKFSEYPVEIFPRALQLVFLIFFPIAVFVYFPTQIMLQRLDIIYLTALISSVLLFYLSLRFWNFCLKKYSSAGG